MSDLFNLTRIFSENSYPQLVQSVENRTYLSNGIDLLRETNENILEATRDLYIALAEAENKSTENNKFADFFKTYKNVVDKYILKARELQSQFEINVETFADANSDILNINDGSDIMSAPTYVGVEYDHLLDPDVPDIEPRKAFKKEFAFIGKLLQDLGPIASEEAKAQVIATVCNNLSSEISDGWLDKVIEHITDDEDCDKEGFARAMYRKFVKDPKKTMTVDIGLVKQCKLSILNNVSYINSVDKSVTNFCDGLSRVADEIGSMFFRNKDHKFPLETDEDGVENKTYRLNDYSFNQMNMFISTKITQITELCNLYIIALSIKMDCIMKYLQQCKDIINTATDGVDNTPNDEVDPGDSEQELDNEEECNASCDPDECEDDSDDTDDDEPDSDDDIDPDTADMEIDAELDGEDDQDSDPEDGFNADDTGAEPLNDNSEDDFEEACYLFEAEAYQAERLITEMMFREAMLTYLDEDATGADKPGIRPAETASAVIQKLMAQFQNLVIKFMNKFSGYDKQISAIKKNRGKIEKAQIPQGWTIQKVNMNNLLSFNVPDLTEQDLGLLGDKDKYLTAKYGEKSNCKIMSDELEGSSAKDRILKLCLDEKESPYTNEERNASLAFVTTSYNKCLANIRNAQSKLKSSQQNAKRLVNVKEGATLESTLVDYFNEMDNIPDGYEMKNGILQKKDLATSKTSKNTPDTQSNANDGKEEKVGDKTPLPKGESNGNLKRSNAVRLYYSVNTGVIVAVMNVYNMAMKKHLKFLKTLAQIGGVVDIPGDNDNNNNQNNNQQ